jgi:PII-like signaling protein
MTMEDCVYLKFFVVENQRHDGQPVYQWLLRQASRAGLPGGSAFRAIAGFGRHHKLHEAHFYELAGELPMEVVFVASQEQAADLAALVAEAGLSLFHYMMPARSGVTNTALGEAGSD